MDYLKFTNKPKLRNPTFVVCWETDAGRLGPGVATYLRRALHGQPFCEIDPVDFFPLGGVSIESDVVMFPATTFYAFPDHDLVVLFSSIPRQEWSHFLNLVMDVAQYEYRAKELYTIGGMVTMGPHTAPRDFWATFTSAQIKKSLSQYGLSRELDFETPPGGRPTLNSFTLWTAKQRNLQGANLWVPVTFYLMNSDDPRGQRRVLEFLDSRLGLQLSFAQSDEDIRRQDDRIVRLRQEQPEIDKIIGKLETEERLTEAEHEQLIREVDEYLRKKP